MRYVVLLRYGLRDFKTVLKVNRAEDGDISCWETIEPFAGMTWRNDGSFHWTADGRAERETHRASLPSLSEPQVAYTVPGPKLLDARIPDYASDVDQGATVQISAHAVLEEPHRVALQLVLVPSGHQPYHRETVGDRRIDDGTPDIWVVLNRIGDDPPGLVAALRVLRWPPPLDARARP